MDAGPKQVSDVPWKKRLLLRIENLRQREDQLFLILAGDRRIDRLGGCSFYLADRTTRGAALSDWRSRVATVVLSSYRIPRNWLSPLPLFSR